MPAAGVFNRITPAWAGKRFRRGKINTRTRDHPRVGGEKSLFYRFVILLVGSPPRGRGKGGRDRPFPHHPGITPAWAGKSGKNPKPLQRTRDHPRVGGEKLRSAISCLLVVGSPPRGRGKAQFGNCPYCHERITPAWAGKSVYGIIPCADKGDHPRVGGEKLLSVTTIRSFLGSPPRGRGKVYQLFRMGYCVGITPAWAGKRSALVWVCAKPWDHPRVGGEKTKLILLFRFRLGSPPRWRGKVAGFSVVVPPAGITPAWAGKSIWP